MASPKVKALSAALALLVSQAASAVGLGEIKLNSALNEPLNAEIELLSVGDLDELELFVNLASRKDFDRAGVPRDFFLNGLQFDVDLSGARPKVVVKSDKPVREPFLDFLVEMQWPSGRLLRNYTLLIDLPVYSDEKAKPKAVQSSRSSQPTPAAQPSTPAPQSSVNRNLEVGSDYEVTRGDTLWSIAKRSRPQGASIHQTMVAIHQLNPGAFVRGDINLLKRGEILRLPAGSQINSSHSDAVADISQQTQSGALIDATDSPAPSAGSQPQSDGRLKLSAATDDAASGDEDHSVSEYDGSETGGVGNSERLSNDLTIAQEELARKDRELEEARDRIALLEQQVATNDRIVEIQNSTLGEAQQAQVQNQQLQQQAEQQAAAEAKVEQQDTPSTVEQTSSEKAPAKPAATESEQGFLAQYKYYLMAGIGLLLVLLVALGLRRKKDDDQGDAFVFDEAPEPTFDEPEPAAAIAELNETGPEEQESEPEPEEEPQEKVVDLSDEDQLFDFEEEDESLEESEPEDTLQGEEEDEDLEELLTQFDEADEGEQQESDDDQDFEAELDLDDALLAEDTSDDEPEETSEPEEDADEQDQAPADEQDAQPEPEDSDDDFDLDMEGDEIGTKLDLAKAYSDVGDADGAREMLEEVIEEGNDEQKAEAKKLLDDLE
ncbi:FimV/HubP family polar landmark protein [Porticoccus sp. GXU_MW_L64]